ncbi:glycosyltransferase family 4 protein [Pseudomonas sp. YH-1]|uniref:glycosyltransferase family 4 protein n=1 Tax=Pseudomonas sp. YH-1 TaxID=3384787 RepID=UPI003F80EA53
MNLLLIHQNFPGQFRHIAQYFSAQPGHRVIAIGRDTAPGLGGVELHRYRPHRVASPQTHPYLQSFESAVLHGQQVARVIQKLKAEGVRPDVILGHPAWGETLYVKDVFPDIPLVHFCEFYYRTQGADVGFDPEFPASLDGNCRLNTRNALHLLNMQQCDWGISPTHWQRSVHPEPYLQKIRVVHEGIPIRQLGPDPKASLVLPSGLELKAGQPVVTFVARNLEPYRGFHSFMRAVPRVLKEHHTAQILVIGGDDVSYGGKPKDAANWRERMLREVHIDHKRVHFLGKVPYETYCKVLQVSAAHVYLTYPFVLSWSMLEAMASGCLVIGSDTAPVREVVRHGENGYLVDFFDTQGIADQVLQALNSPQTQQALRAEARETACRYSVEAGLTGYRELIAEALSASGKQPAPTTSSLTQLACPL